MKRTLSAKDPVINAGVITANFIWNNANSRNGIVEARLLCGKVLTPSKKKYSKGFPMMPYFIPLISKPKESPKDRENPTAIQISDTTPREIKLCSIVESIFFCLPCHHKRKKVRESLTELIPMRLVSKQYLHY